MDANGFYVEGHGSSGNMETPHGYCVWQWTTESWEMIQDLSTENGVPQQPVVAGAFVGQLRAVVCQSKVSLDA